ncbi:response regulator [Paraburkholderia caribensis]|uniref:hybrid sensor histidine kinase/response regulator n=1 Tax=Paraburkholderia caribensis TaxID=75105 RepID=UPI001CAF7991|nr:putative Histidine kinase [Paraburkholderia caribensis]
MLTEDVTNLLASTEIATLLLDRQGLIKRFTPSAGAMFGLASPDTGRAIAEVLGAPLGDALMPDVDQVLSGVTGQAEREIETATGQWYVRRITPYATVRNRPAAGAVITWTDITHVKRLDERARRLCGSRSGFERCRHDIRPHGPLSRLEQGRYHDVRVQRNGSIAMSVSDLLPAGARQDHLDFIQHALHNEASHSYETRRVAKDGRVIDIWLTMSILRDDVGNVTGVASTERDLTERSMSNAYLRERAEQLAQADHRKNEFLAVLGHELRNPLAALVSATTLLRSAASDDARKSWATGVIERQGRALMLLVNDMLDLTRITTGNIELNRQTVLLKTVVQSAIEVCQPIVDERRHSLSVSLPAESVLLYVDATRLSQVIENIVINSAKFTAFGGSIRLSATTTAHRLLLSIKDNGRGIAPAMLGTLFEMFVQGPASGGRRNNGLGVGLSVVKRLVELHGGSVRAISDGVTGSEFIIDLPLDAAPKAAKDILVESAPSGADLPKRILIVDDNVDAAEALAILLTMQGHEVETRADGASGMAAVTTYRPDIILLDIGLPDMDGYEVARQLRESGASEGMTLIAVTGYGSPADRIRSAEAGFDHHLTKPVEADELIRLLAG